MRLSVIALSDYWQINAPLAVSTAWTRRFNRPALPDSKDTGQARPFHRQNLILVSSLKRLFSAENLVP
ncbi:hypothetical protein ACP179_01755 (plasmid) [Xenorhabdus stockiae]|uniref:hypothetical protein n=1 Tax=Xenorhabdus stockiae TaxID=351614 RepID=UPI003CE87269